MTQPNKLPEQSRQEVMDIRAFAVKKMTDVVADAIQLLEAPADVVVFCLDLSSRMLASAVLTMNETKNENCPWTTERQCLLGLVPNLIEKTEFLLEHAAKVSIKEHREQTRQK